MAFFLGGPLDGAFGGGSSGALEDALVVLVGAGVGALRLGSFFIASSSSEVNSLSGELKGPGI